MPSSRDIQMLLRYTAWADAKLYESLESAHPDVISAPRPGRPAGLSGTLSHIYAVDLIWKAHLEGTDHGFKTRNLDEPLPLAQLSAKQAAIDRWYVDHADGLPETALAQVVDFRFVDGGPGSLSRADMLLHVVNHKTYHRGYVADMLYESGLRPPTMDLPVFLRDAWRGAPQAAHTPDRESHGI